MLGVDQSTVSRLAARAALKGALPKSDLFQLARCESGHDFADSPLIEQANGRYDRLGHTLGGGPTVFLIIERDAVRVASGTTRTGSGRRLGRRGSAVLKASEAPPREAVKLVPDDADGSLQLAGSSLPTTSPGLPVLGEEVESRRSFTSSASHPPKV